MIYTVRIFAILVMITCNLVLADAQTESRHSLKVFFQALSGRYTLNNIQQSGTGTTLNTKIPVPDIDIPVGISYSYSFTERLEIRSTFSYAVLPFVYLGFNYDTPHSYTDISGPGTFSGYYSINNIYNSYNTAFAHSIFMDIGPVWTLTNGRLIQTKTRLAVGLMGNNLEEKDDLTFRYVDGSTGATEYIHLGDFDIRQKNYFKSFAGLELMAEVKLGQSGFYTSIGILYRIFLGQISDTSSVRLIDGADNLSEFQFTAGFRQFGAQFGFGYRF